MHRAFARSPAAAALTLLLAAVMPGEAHGAAAQPQPQAPAATGPVADYTVTIRGVEDPDLQSILEQSSQLIALEDRPPATLGGLERRAADDLDRLKTVLKSEGYYAGTVTYTAQGDKKPAVVTLTVAPGALYKLKRYDVRLVGPGANDPALPHAAAMSPGEPARGPAIVDAEQALLRQFHNLGYPFAAEKELKVIADEKAQDVSVDLTIETGVPAVFGPVTITGLKTVDEAYVRRFLRWREGERYDQSKVDAAHLALTRTGLFSSVDFTPADRPDASGRVPIALALREGKQRSVGFGASYSSSEGFGSQVFWEHRNLLHQNEHFRLSLNASEIEQSLSADFRKPNYRRWNQNLLANASVARRTTDAYDEESLATSVGLERPLTEHWRGSLGAGAEYSHVKDDQGTRSFIIVPFPIGANFDNTDDILNPSRGARMRVQLTPSVATVSQTVAFLATEWSGSSYLAVDSAKRLILAGRARVGSIIAADTEQIPASKRLYAGGGGSIRGYKFQSVGPLDSKNDPLGGRSVVELGLEARTRITDTIGLVPFVDGGTVYDASFPDGSEPIRWAAGLGLRYFTAVGPVRFDIAFPLNGRKGVDGTFEFYISLGQAF
jgi:translocation and assembly module TamA